MVSSGQSSIRPVEFASSSHPDLPVEVLERRDVLRRLGRSHFSTPERPAFHMLLFVRSGRGIHSVDFTDLPMLPGRMVQIYPGQVQAWDAGSDFEATLVLSRWTTTPTPLELVRSPPYRDLGRDSRATAAALLDAIRREQDHFTGDEASSRLLTTLFEALCRVFDREAAAPPPHLPDAYVAFCRAIEDGLSSSHTVRDHVASLGFSERTVNRACQKVTGQRAKAVLNDRLVLEAKRLLAHTDRSAASVSAELGFSEPTNFHKFFVRHAGLRPIQFRDRYRRPRGRSRD